MEGVLKRAKRRKYLHPARLMVIGFMLLILLGTLFLNLPAASQSGGSVGAVGALFTATTSTCVTGLTVFTIHETFTLFGQLVILALIQCGGLGFMVMTTMVFMVLGRRIGLANRMYLQESLNMPGLQGVVGLARRIVMMTLAIEMAGAICLATQFVPLLGMGKGLYYAVFHSISAFCNAGIDLFGGYPMFVDNVVVNVTTMLLITFGGLGFYVMFDLREKLMHKKHRLALHTRLVLVVSMALVVLGTLCFALLEWNNPRTLATGELNPAEKVMAAAFQAVTLRTAGFATVSQEWMTMPSHMLSIILMFVGASPASTGGGIKTTTFALTVLAMAASIRGREDVNAFKRRIPKGQVSRAIAVVCLSLLAVLCMMTLVAIIENIAMGIEDLRFDTLLFEVVSAFGTVGLTMGITPQLHEASQVLVSLLMLVGRVGPITMVLGLASRKIDEAEPIRYPEEHVMVG